MKKLLFIISIVILPLWALGQTTTQKDSAKLAWEELMRKCKIEDSLREVELRKPILNAFNKDKRRYIGRTYYLKKGSKLYKKGSAFRCVDLALDNDNNASIILVHNGDTLTMDATFNDWNNKIEMTNTFNSLFYSGSGAKVKEKINYRFVAKTLYVGMSKESVLILMGKPKNIRTTIAENINYEFWEYPDNVYLNFLNDKLKVIQIQ